MIHRALMGSLERFFGCLIEHYAGAFPVWLAPVQVAVLPISDANVSYAESVCRKLRDEGLRAELNSRDEKIGHKIRAAQLQKIPYMLVVGRREQEESTVSVRHRKEGDQGPVPLDAFIERITQDIESKAIW
jgi:threonyl-tRNA synthetase